MEIPYTVEIRPDTGLSNGKLGVWLFLSSEVMLFAALFSSYILLRTGAKPLNFYQYSNPELDELMDEAVRQPTTAQMDSIYQKCSQIVLDDAIWIPLCLPPNSTIAHSHVTGIEDNSFYAAIFWPQSLKRT